MLIKSHVTASASVAGITNQMGQMNVGGFPGQYPGQAAYGQPAAPTYTACAPRTIVKTETIPSNLNPRWRPVQIDVCFHLYHLFAHLFLGC